jgi:hypothetical protein
MSNSNNATDRRVTRGELDLIEAITRADDFWRRLLRAKPATGYDPTESELVADGIWDSSQGNFHSGGQAQYRPREPKNGRGLKSIIVVAMMALVLSTANLAKAQQEIGPDHFEASSFEINLARNVALKRSPRGSKGAGRRSGQHASVRHASQRPARKEITVKR